MLQGRTAEGVIKPRGGGKASWKRWACVWLQRQWTGEEGEGGGREEHGTCHGPEAGGHVAFLGPRCSAAWWAASGSRLMAQDQTGQGLDLEGGVKPLKS